MRPGVAVMAAAAAALLLVAPSLGSGLRDNPIQAPYLQYLDGTAWTASAQIHAPAECRFQQSVDFDDAAQLPFVPASTMQQCCAACARNAECKAAVWNGDQFRTCYLKSASAKQKASTSNNWACSVVGGGQVVDNVNIPATVPGDVITDLQNAGYIGDPYFELNFLNHSSVWADEDWTYETTFSLPSRLAATHGAGDAKTLLVFDGVKMGASVEVNGQRVGEANDQFLRFAFELGPAHSLVFGEGNENTLKVTLNKSIELDNRWMACTGGWDWAPYTDTFQDKAPTFSRGLWKSVYIASIPANTAAIAHVKPLVHYLGPYPTSPLNATNHGDFEVRVTVYLSAPAQVEGTLQVTSEWGSSSEQSITVPAGESEFVAVLYAASTEIDLWWPVGMGDHRLYDISVAFTPAQDALAPRALMPALADNTVKTTRRIGFRTFAIVTGNDTDPAYVQAAQSEEGSDSLGMFFRVNGAAVYSRGANMIPMEELEGRMDGDAHKNLVTSAAAANMNTLRVWGGGVYLPDSWYDTCDELGVMVYHDMQYATGGPHDDGGGPQYTKTQFDEMVHMLRRLSHHPSIVIWDACNECGGQGLYASFVMTVVASEDDSRAVWPSAPSTGWETGTHKLTQLPNGNRLFPKRSGPTIETHGPYYHGNGFPAVNGAINGPDTGFKPVPFPPMMPLTITPTNVGPQFGNVFTSEFGASVFSSFESMAPTLDKAHWGVHGGGPGDNCTLGFQSQCNGSNPMSQRNYPCDNTVITYFGEQDFDAVGEAAFKKQLYLCMLGQALTIKQQVETMRSGNMFGTLLWQLNEIWPTGGWGSLEYGSPKGTKGEPTPPGQVTGGRWKPLHYQLRRATFADVLVTCGADSLCYVRNDAPTPLKGTVTVSQVELKSSAINSLVTVQVSLPAGAGAIEYFKLPSVAVNASTHVLTGVVECADSKRTFVNLIHLLPPKNLTAIPNPRVTFEVTSTSSSDATIKVTNHDDGLALYVMLTTLANGWFSDNAFVLLGNEDLQVTFHAFGELDGDLLKSSLRLEHLGAYL